MFQNALLDAQGYDIDVHALLQGFLRGARQAGARLRTGVEPQLARHDGQRWQVTLSDGSAWTGRTVVDAAGNPIDGARLVNTAPYPSQAVTGDKGPGKAEILMDREEFRIKVQSVNGQPVSSETSRTMSLIAPVPSDIAGKLGDACPTVDNCPLPPYKHFSYVIVFKRTF